MAEITDDPLPPELKSVIVGFCGSRDLPNVALASKEFQALAEKQIYVSIDVASRGEKGIPALNAAVGNTSRPAYINFLSIEIDGSEWSHPADQSTIEMFLRAAPSMSGLKDLRIRLREELSANISGMNDMLCAGRFQLTTLFVDEELDFPRIVQEQKELNVVMIYSSDDFPALPMLLSAPISPPLIMLGLAQEPTVYPMFLNHLAIAPEIVSPSHTSLGDLVKAAFRRDVMRGFRLRLDEIKIISVFLQSPTWQDSIQPYMKCVVDLFTEIDELHIHLHSPGEFKLEAPLVEPCVWPSIEVLMVRPWEEDSLSHDAWRRAQSDAALGCYLQKWQSARPNLTRIM